MAATFPAVGAAPCPFCGHDEIHLVHGMQDGWLQCQRCGATSTRESSNEAALRAWNRRAHGQGSATLNAKIRERIAGHVLAASPSELIVSEKVGVEAIYAIAMEQEKEIVGWKIEVAAKDTKIENLWQIIALQTGKILRQRNRINYLEGATHHAGGTPLSVANRKLAAVEAILHSPIQGRPVRPTSTDLDAFVAYVVELETWGTECHLRLEGQKVLNPVHWMEFQEPAPEVLQHAMEHKKEHFNLIVDPNADPQTVNFKQYEQEVGRIERVGDRP